MGKIAIIYGSSTGATEAVAKKIQEQFDGADLFNTDSVTTDELKPYDFYILGASTTGVGDLQDDWDMFLPKFEKMDFSGKKAAIFGLGDSASFSTSFAGAMYVLYKALKSKVDIIGSVSADGYTFDESDSVVDGRFVGLALDEDNEYDETAPRIEAWVKELKKQLA
ncbi:flavodoxin [Dysgonomonas sp. 511]|uniref:flavodoxin n=1 Tax=Dysgonomonas sp. 511 TaxID=2302930 RepID=UPI0013D8E023|nr:flavodoxin [Dysgonomonas sp. 511]NDV79149.1 flavodoxin [Dysgonomonas sp. 511]